MESYQNSKLSLGEQLYIWIFIYIVKTKFYVENHIPNWDAAYCFGFLQWLNLVVIWLDIRYNFNLLQVGGSWSGNVFNGCECITIFSKIRSDYGSP